ncbi:MAG: hypothetical protein KF819_30490 [Labilithrix sp.]|nr:hypothetical protein [Labilithrix sp.]
MGTVRWIISEYKRLLPYFALLDFAAKPRSRVGWLIRVAVTAFATVVLWKRVNAMAAPLLDAKPPIPIPSEEIEDYRFRLPERIRKEIFLEIAGAEQAERARAVQQNTWHGHLWSREDDRGHVERMHFRQLAAQYRISLTQMYLILDEGIREKWPGPDGEPLPATTPPLNPRQTW